MENEETKIDWNDVIGHIVRKTLKQYPFLEEDDIRSAAHEGGWQAFLKFDPQKCKVEKVKYVLLKGYFETIDILRKEKWLSKPGDAHYKTKIYDISNASDSQLSLNYFKTSQNDFEKMWFELTDGLDAFDKKILHMKFVENKSMKEMCSILDVYHRTLQLYMYNAKKKLCLLQQINADIKPPPEVIRSKA